jgi:hypothetical protein
MSNKYETYFRDEEKKEKMILIPHVAAVNVASALSLGLIARHDIETTTPAPQHETTTVKQHETHAPQRKSAKRGSVPLTEFLTDKALLGDKV